MGEACKERQTIQLNREHREPQNRAIPSKEKEKSKMLKRLLKRYLGEKSWKYVKIGLAVAALILILYTLYQAFTPINVPDLSSQPLQPQVKEFTEHRLVSIPAEGMVGGVLAGIAYFFTIPLWLVRIVFVVAVVYFDDGLLVLLYLLFWIFMPSIDFIPADFIARTEG